MSPSTMNLLMVGLPCPVDKPQMAGLGGCFWQLVATVLAAMYIMPSSKVGYAPQHMSVVQARTAHRGRTAGNIG